MLDTTDENGQRSNPGADKTGSAMEMNGMNSESSSVTYKVYRRRWFGLSVLMIMNIVISWGVRLTGSCLPSLEHVSDDPIQWLTFAPVSTASVEYYGLASDTPINWLSTVVLFAYVVASP